MSALASLRADIPLLARCRYLDAAALSPTPRRVLDAWRDHLLAYPVNVERGESRIAAEALGIFERARDAVARILLGAHGDELVLTSGATEALNLAVDGVPLQAGDNVVTTVAEHHAMLLPLVRRARRAGAELRIARRVDGSGTVDPGEIAALCDARTRLLGFQHASNVTGAVQPVAACIALVRARSEACLIAVDGAQMAGHAPLDVASLGCDLYALSGHKGPLGPPGTGGLWIARGLVDLLEPARLGGGAVEDVAVDGSYRLRRGPRRHEPGTPDVAGAVALAAGARILEEAGLDVVARHVGGLVASLREGLDAISSVRRIGSGEAGAVSFVVGELPAVEVAARLELEAGVHVRAGHHCALPLHRTMGTFASHGGTVRASLHAWSDAEDVAALLSGVAAIAAA